MNLHALLKQMCLCAIFAEEDQILRSFVLNSAVKHTKTLSVSAILLLCSAGMADDCAAVREREYFAMVFFFAMENLETLVHCSKACSKAGTRATGRL